MIESNRHRTIPVLVPHDDSDDEDSMFGSAVRRVGSVQEVAVETLKKSLARMLVDLEDIVSTSSNVDGTFAVDEISFSLSIDGSGGGEARG